MPKRSITFSNVLVDHLDRMTCWTSRMLTLQENASLVTNFSD